MIPSKPVWSPGEERVERANLSRFMRFVREETGNADVNSYAPLYRFSVEQPDRFWTLLWDFCGIRGSGDRSCVIVDADRLPGARWFPNVSLNFAQNLLRFDDERVAIRFRTANGDNLTTSYAQLQRQVAALAAALRAQGIAPGDRIAALAPACPDALIAMLATASIGAVWSARAPTGDLDDACRRLADLAPRLVFVADGAAGAGTLRALRAAVPGLATLVQLSGVEATPICEAATALADFVAPFADAASDYTPVAFDHPLYLTEAGDERVVHGAGGTLIQHLKEWVLHVDLKREDKVLFHAGIDSMAWYWLASSLAVGATIVLLADAELPADGPRLWDRVDEFGITVLGVHSDWLNAAATAGGVPKDSHRLLPLKTILTAGGTLAPESYDFVYRDVKERVFLSPISTGGDTLACFAIGAPLLPVWRGELSCRGLGMKVEVLDAQGTPVVGEAGDLACTAPFPSLPLGFWNDAGDARFQAAFFGKHPGRWCRGERAVLTARDGLIPMPGDPRR
ncbi:AMP-binding protein [Arenimonas oryziterrae]|uniref:AMP-dependent synthetase/ligase domain-containing protein n=1 Tax=Arenimonas oryziterrae DSM 21050 = YC6267 TaxID=1121015 RepID=A0A091ATC1_9GAMM|nr:AMP-binding protein [Arenimonas oryziterrae]KFN42616.1 hypothetical protein N789_13325 [Arenimonas oryziterrae DSM 21050 = YC6267]